jgi:hypothetical protein
MSRPAPINSIAQSAISEITSERRRLFLRPQIALTPDEVRLVSCRTVCTSRREARSAGASPNRIADNTQTANVNARAARPMPTSFTLGTPCGPRSRTQCKARNATAMPKAPPVNARSTLSVSNWRTIRARVAPSAVRTAISFWRATPRDSCRFARLTHAISRTKATAPSNRYNVRRTLPTTCSRSGTIPNVRPPLVGYTSGNSCRRCAVMVSISACACCTETPGFSLPMML